MDAKFLERKKDRLRERMMDAQDGTELRPFLLQEIILLRLDVLREMNDLADAESKLNTFRRMMSAVMHDCKCKDTPGSSQYFDLLLERVKQHSANIADIGESLAMLLDYWQANGASLHELCNLCNVNFDDIEWKLSPDDYSKPFSLFVPDLALGYKNAHDSLDVRDFLNVPILYALQEYFFSQVGAIGGEIEEG